jgi:hypothetical protein
MVSGKLKDALTPFYTILNSQDNPKKIPDRKTWKNDYLLQSWNEQNPFRFGATGEFKWIETAFIESHDYDISEGFYIYSDSPEKTKTLENKLHEAYNLVQFISGPCIFGADDLDFYLTLADLTMKDYSPTEEEVSELLTLVDNGSFRDQIAAIEILAHSKSYKALYHLARLADYKVYFESEPDELLMPFYHPDYQQNKSWLRQGTKKDTIIVEFMNAKGELKGRLDMAEKPIFNNELIHLNDHYLYFPLFQSEIHSFVFNAGLRLRKNLGESFDWKQECEKVYLNV